MLATRLPGWLPPRVLGGSLGLQCLESLSEDSLITSCFSPGFGKALSLMISCKLCCLGKMFSEHMLACIRNSMLACPQKLGSRFLASGWGDDLATHSGGPEFRSPCVYNHSAGQSGQGALVGLRGLLGSQC